jgi:hypothetical protein
MRYEDMWWIINVKTGFTWLCAMDQAGIGYYQPMGSPKNYNKFWIYKNQGIFLSCRRVPGWPWAVWWGGGPKVGDVMELRYGLGVRAACMLAVLGHRRRNVVYRLLAKWCWRNTHLEIVNRGPNLFYVACPCSARLNCWLTELCGPTACSAESVTVLIMHSSMCSCLGCWLDCLQSAVMRTGDKYSHQGRI